MRTILLVLAFAASLQVHSQETLFSPLFRHFDVGVTTGTLGVGLEVATPVTSFMDVRTGFTYMPHFEVTMDFPIQVYDKNGKPDATSFQRMAEKMADLSGYQVDSQVDMIGTPRYNNFKFLLDFKPFRNKNWSVTAGFYIGGRNIAKAYNSTEEMPSLFAVKMFNHIRQKYLDGDPLTYYMEQPIYIDPATLGRELEKMGDMGIRVGNYTHDVLYQEDVYNTMWVPDDPNDPDNPQNSTNDGPGYEAGELVVHKANDPNDPLHVAGDPYLMQPDENSMVKARIRVNSFRPYLGFGYGGRLLKKDDRYHIHFECGALFWGGTPAIITHDGTNLSKDVTDIDGKVGRYVDFFSSFKVYPLLNLRVTRRF